MGDVEQEVGLDVGQPGASSGGVDTPSTQISSRQSQDGALELGELQNTVIVQVNGVEDVGSTSPGARVSTEPDESVIQYWSSFGIVGRPYAGESVLLLDFRSERQGIPPTPSQWERLVLSLAAVGTMDGEAIDQQLRRHDISVNTARKVRGGLHMVNPSVHMAENNRHLQNVWGPAVRPEIDGGREDGKTPFISDEEFSNGGYDDIRHVLVYRLKWSGEHKARLANKGNDDDDQLFAEDSPFAPSLNFDTLM